MKKYTQNFCKKLTKLDKTRQILQHVVGWGLLLRGMVIKKEKTTFCAILMQLDCKCFVRTTNCSLLKTHNTFARFSCGEISGKKAYGNYNTHSD